MNIKLMAIMLSVLVTSLLGTVVMTAYYRTAVKRAENAEAQIVLQGKVIARQADLASLYNKVAADSVTAAAGTDARSQENVIEYRTILRREKSCDYAIPADIADGLLRTTYRLRTAALPASASRTDRSGTGAASSGRLTYCQAVLWIAPLLAAIEKANHQLASVREIQSVNGGTPGSH
ncbi:hypothetical protein [Tatumella ptyseos]|mgnify:CR=1 FL=1|uniref:hypothetical protein n=1 Tax=Tatumella ptyseos TaxID=82987 RepID=UPI0023F0B9EF|nr:hypothetical protein [Tatumella ptyseos]